jgi:GTPase involved in cell partitioning and DNA repair
MKIVLLALPRTGSSSILKYVTQAHKEIETYGEPFNTLLYKIPILYSKLILQNNVFIKTMFADNPPELQELPHKDFIKKLHEDFDKVVCLFRKNKKEHIESYAQAESTNKWVSQYKYYNEQPALLDMLKSRIEVKESEMIEVSNELGLQKYYYEDLYLSGNNYNMKEFLSNIGVRYDETLYRNYLDISKKYRISSVPNKLI